MEFFHDVWPLDIKVIQHINEEISHNAEIMDYRKVKICIAWGRVNQ